MAKGALVDWRLHIRREVEVDDDEEIHHIVATWPTAVCGADLTEREGRQRPLFELFETEDPICLGCIEAHGREREAARPSG